MEFYKRTRPQTQGRNRSPHRVVQHGVRETFQRVIAVHLNHLERGLRTMWDRPAKCYGFFELSEYSLSKQVEYSLKEVEQGCPKLRESYNILTPLQSANGDQYLSGVIVLGTAQRITL